MLRVISFLILFLNLILPFCLLSAQDQPEVSSLKEFKTIPDKVAEQFLTRIFDGKPLDLPDDLQVVPADSKLWDVWRGNSVDMLAAVNNFKLEFKRGADLFALTFDFTDNRTILRHGTPHFSEQRGGFRLFNFQSEARKFFYRGQGQSGVVVLLPKLGSKEIDRGAVLCPRDFVNEGTRKDKSALRDVGFSLIRAGGDVQGKVRGLVSNKLDFVMARARIFTSTGVAPASQFLDEAYSHKALVELAYEPDQSQLITEIPNLSDFALGLEGLLELQFSAGYKRISRKSATVFVKQMDIKQEFTVPIGVAETAGTPLEYDLQVRGITMQGQGVIEARVLPGTCYLVLNHVAPIIHEYLKAPFQLPDKYTKEE